MKIYPMIGKKFGKLTILSRGEDSISASLVKHPTYICQCDCGNKEEVVGRYLRRPSNAVRSCSKCSGGRMGTRYLKSSSF